MFFRDSFWAVSTISLLSTQLVFLTHSQLAQSQLQPRITVIVTGLDSKDNINKTRHIQRWTSGFGQPTPIAFIMTSGYKNNCFFQGWAPWKARPFSLYLKTEKVRTPVHPLGWVTPLSGGSCAQLAGNSCLCTCGNRQHATRFLAAVVYLLQGPSRKVLQQISYPYST